MSSKPFIDALHIYPIKSCAGINVAEAFVGPRGLQSGQVRDRSWMLIDDNSVMVSQREHPLLATVKVSMPHGIGSNAGNIIVSAKGMPDLELDPTHATGSERLVTVHKDRVWAHFATPDAHEWFSHLLNEHVRLVHQTVEDERECDPVFARHGEQVGFADGFPFLVTSRATLDALNKASDTEVPMNRFRPNIVVGGAVPNAEYGWKVIEFGNAKLELVKPCTRCVMTTIDQALGEKTGKQPLKALGQVAMLDEVINNVRVKGVVFGENAVTQTEGIVKRGDAVRVLEAKPAYSFG